MTEITDEMILEKARSIQEIKGISLTDAMIEAQAALAPPPAIPQSFTVTISVKPRVARWIMEEFKQMGEYSTEDRLAAYLGIVLNRARVSAMRIAKDAPDIVEGQAVTLTREQFQKKAPNA